MDDTFVVHEHIREIFEKKPSKDKLLLWWNQEGKRIYFENLRVSAENPLDRKRWGAEPEISALAFILEINILWKKNDGKRILGIGGGVIHNLSSQEKKTLNILGVGENFGTLFILNSSTKENLEEAIKKIDETLFTALSKYIEKKSEGSFDVPSLIENVHIDDASRTLLKKRNIINANNNFINDGRKLEKLIIRCRMSGADTNLREKVLNHFKYAPVVFTLENMGIHWEYSRSDDNESEHSLESITQDTSRDLATNSNTPGLKNTLLEDGYVKKEKTGTFSTQEKLSTVSSLRKNFEDSIEFRNFQLYVKPLGERQADSQESFSVIDEIDTFLKITHQRSLLILGDSGVGKSLLGCYMAWGLWKAYKANNDRIPLFISLPLIPSHELGSQLLEAFLRSEGLNNKETHEIKGKPLLLILDGYDELPEVGNLYLSNHWQRYDIKVIITCRPEILLQRQTKDCSYQSLFLPERTSSHTALDCFNEFRLKRFTSEQINLYLQQYIKNNSDEQKYQDWKVYRQYLDFVPGLFELATTPFILNMIIPILPKIIQEHKGKVYQQKKLVKIQIYDYFIDYWFDRQISRLTHLSYLKGDLKNYLKLYSQNLAYRALKTGRLDIAIEESETLDPSLLGQESFDTETMKAIRSGCLLKTGKNYFSFLHKSLAEYFASQDLSTGLAETCLVIDEYTQELKPKESNTRFRFNENLLTSEPAIIRCLADRVLIDENFKDLLYQVVKISKKRPWLSTAAANAITMLNLSGESFSTKDFSYICISRANLSGSICDETNFHGADVSQVCFNHAWLRGANFSQANMDRVDFAELPSIEHSREISSIAIDPKGEWLLIADTAGNLIKWSISSQKIISTNRIAAYGRDLKLGAFFNFLPISGLTVSFDGKLAAMATFDGIVHLWDVQRERKIKSFITEQAKNRDIMSARRIRNILFTPDGKKIIFGGYETDLQMWDIDTNKCICEFENAYGYHLTISPDGKLLVATGRNDSLYIYDLIHDSKSSQSKLPIKVLPIKATDTTFSPNGKWLGITIGDYNEIGYVQLLEKTSWKSIKTFRLNGITLGDLSFSPDEQLLIAKSRDEFQIWDIKSGSYLYNLVFPRSTDSGANIPSQHLIFSPVSKRHIYYAIDTRVHVWLIQTAPNPLKRAYYHQELKFVEQGCKQQSECYNTESITLTNQDLKTEIAIDNTSGSLKVTKGNQLLRTFEFKTKGNKNYAGETLGILLSPNQRYIVFSYMDTDGFEGILTLPAQALVKRLAPLGSDTDIRVWDLEKGELIHTFSHHNQIISMIFSTDSQWLITAGYTVRVWDIRSGNCIHRYDQHKHWADAVALTSNKQWLAIADGDKCLSLWNTETHKLVYSVPQLSTRIKKLYFSSDDSYLVGYTEKVVLEADQITMALDNQLVFKLHIINHHQASLNLINRSGNLNLNCVNANLNEVYALSEENQQLTKQRGGIVGKPAAKPLIFSQHPYTNPTITSPATSTTNTRNQKSTAPTTEVHYHQTTIIQQGNRNVALNNTSNASVNTGFSFK